MSYTDNSFVTHPSRINQAQKEVGGWCWIEQHVHNLWRDKSAEVELLPAKKASKAQKKREKEEHERQIRERELARVSEAASQPESTEDFERLVMGDPNSSMVWIQYMAFLISLGEIEKARGIAERGLATINYRQVHSVLVDFCRQLRTCMQARLLHLGVRIHNAGSTNEAQHLIVLFCDDRTFFYDLYLGLLLLLHLFLGLLLLLLSMAIIVAGGVVITASTVFVGFVVGANLVRTRKRQNKNFMAPDILTLEHMVMLRKRQTGKIMIIVQGGG